MGFVLYVLSTDCLMCVCCSCFDCVVFERCVVRCVVVLDLGISVVWVLFVCCFVLCASIGFVCVCLFTCCCCVVFLWLRCVVCACVFCLCV